MYAKSGSEDCQGRGVFELPGGPWVDDPGVGDPLGTACRASCGWRPYCLKDSLWRTGPVSPPRRHPSAKGRRPARCRPCLPGPPGAPFRRGFEFRGPALRAGVASCELRVLKARNPRPEARHPPTGNHRGGGTVHRGGGTVHRGGGTVPSEAGAPATNAIIRDQGAPGPSSRSTRGLTFTVFARRLASSSAFSLVG